MRWRHDFPELLTLDDLDRVMASTETQPVLLYKHSLTCGTSAFALEQLTQLEQSDVPVPIHLVPVQTARAVSDAIAERLTLRHESPQLILVDHGAVSWHTSHLCVNVDKAREALAALGLVPPAG
jgi:bacillithiol system protein YtxJ